MHFLSFFNFAFSPCQGTWLQGYKGRMHSPLVPVHVPMDLQGHFLNILLSEKENILSLILYLGHFDKIFDMSLVFYILGT